MIKMFSVISTLYFATIAMAQIPKVTSGTIQHFENFPSQFVKSRNVDVWLPNDYDAKKQYNVLYMHDGAALFDSTLMFNKQSWGVDETLGRLIKEKKISDVIVVGIWNGGALRACEYMPQKPIESLTQRQKDSIYQLFQFGKPEMANVKVQSDNYLKFLVTELKPFIDGKFSTLKNRENTFIAGSSMGGLISIYAISEYPAIFGGAACLSTHWPGLFSLENNPMPNAFFSYLQKNLPDPNTHKIYFDHGTINLDALYPPLQQKVDGIMKTKGFSEKSWITRIFEGKDHNELSWQERFEIPVLFLLSKKP